MSGKKNRMIEEGWEGEKEEEEDKENLELVMTVEAWWQRGGTMMMWNLGAT